MTELERKRLVETDRRIARTSIKLLKDRLKKLGRQRDVRRKERMRTAASLVSVSRLGGNSANATMAF